MAGTFTSTGTYSNLTRLELESLRFADDFAIGKALTVGDSALPPEGIVGPGLDPSAEPFLTGPTVKLDDVYTITPPPQPGPGLGTLDQPGVFVSETVKWYGPTYITDGTAGYAASVNSWEDLSGQNFVLAGVQAGDILLIKTGGSANGLAVATVTVVLSPTTLVLGSIRTSGGGAQLTVDSRTNTSGYLVMRPNAVQLFAVPSSGATGFEQTFLVVTPGSAIHDIVAPTTDEINAARLLDLVPSQYALDATVDRADSVFDSPAPRTSLDKLGYRIVLYPDNGTGTGPNLAAPIATLTPVINTGIPSTDQRMTVDYKAGVVRFSCAPSATGSQIKVAGGVNSFTGRLNLYAVFWGLDTTLTSGASRSVYGIRSSATEALTPARVYYDTTNNAWRLGATTSTNAMLVQAPNPTEDARVGLSFGAYDNTAGVTQHFRYFTYRQGANRWKFVNRDLAIPSFDTASSIEMNVGESLAYTVAGQDSPPAYGADFMPTRTLNTSSSGRGARDTSAALQSALLQASIGAYSTVRLKRGRYQITDGVIYVPPGVTIEGEGANTTVQIRNVTAATNTTIKPGFKFGPNTPYGVYDLTWNGTNVEPTTFDYSASNVAQKIEGVGVVWNPVRRVWGVAWADVNLNAIWFNEIHRDGTTTFPGLGVNAKNDSTLLFSWNNANSQFHSGGHYPRLAHQANADQYVVTWVSQITLAGVIGPQVWVNTIQVNPAISDPTPTSPTGTPATLTFVSSSPYAPNDVGVFNTDHISIAVDNNSTSPLYNIFCTYWQYSYNGTTLSDSEAVAAVMQNPSGIEVSSVTGGSFGNFGIVSSTDVDEDSAGNALHVWSVRAHPLLTGTAGSFGNVEPQQFADTSVSNWTNTGVVVGSRFCYLGAPGAYAFTYDPVYGIPNTNYNLVPYGTDGVVFSLGTSTIGVHPDFINVPNPTGVGAYTPGSPYIILNSTLTAGSGTTTLVDSTQDFTTNGVAVGDMVLIPTPGAFPSTPSILTVAPGGNVHELTLSYAPPDLTSGNTYRIYYGRTFNWAIVPPSQIQGVQYTNGTYVNSIIQIAGYNWQLGEAASYVLEPVEPDFARVRHGGDNWLVVYQSFKTTSWLARDSQKNFNDGLNTWNGLSFLDNTLIMREANACYRWHLSTCAVVLSGTGTALNTSLGQGLNTGSGGTTTFATKASRDVEISNRSLGAADPITYRANYLSSQSPTNNVTGNTRAGQNLALQVSPQCWFHRWLSTSPGPSLIPDVTWTGDDWVVVSPTKKSIHSYTGNMIVSSGGLAYLGDPSFYFGQNEISSVDENFLRQTVQINDFIYFPAIGVYTAITQFHSEHTVELQLTDSELFHFGNSTQTGRIEWYLIRTVSGGPQILGGGVRSLGYRVSYDGKIILSSSYMTFADELPDNAGVNPGSGNAIEDRQPLMSRSGYDYSMFWANPNSLTGILGSDGYNLPGGIGTDIVQPEGRYMADVGFRGVAPGQPHGTNDQLQGEPTFCAIAWGENLYGYLEHIGEGAVAAATGGSSTATNQIRFYRQSFGPYNSGMRNLKIQGFYTPPQNGPATNQVGSELKVLTQQRVYTRHGGPVNGQGNFATDGFRNFVAAADKLGLFAYNGSVGVVARPPFAGAGIACIQGWYTDAVGRFALQTQGPETRNQPWPGLTLPLPNFFRDDVNGNTVALNPSAPRVHWDGTRFVVFWTEGGGSGALGGFSESPTLICMASFPGGEDGGLQGPEMVNPNDIFIKKQVAQVAHADARNTTSSSAAGISSFNLTIIDIAFSGRVYGVLWTAGLDQGSVDDNGQACAFVGVSLFENAGSGGNLIDGYEPQPYGESTGSTSGSAMTDSLGGWIQQNPPVNKGDILVVPPGSANSGVYLVTGGFPITVYPAFPVTASNVQYYLHRPRTSQGAATYVLDSTYQALARDAYTSPCIVWDGKQFVCLWRTKLVGLSNFTNADQSGIAFVEFPETGLGHPPVVKRFGTGNQTTGASLNSYDAWASTEALGMIRTNDAFGGNVVFMCNPTFASATGSNGTITGSSTSTFQLYDSIQNFYEGNGGRGPVRPGDILIITNGSNAKVLATVISIVSETELLCSNDFAGLSNDATAFTYNIFQQQRYKVAVGDIVRAGPVYTGSTDNTAFHGEYMVSGVDLYNNCFYVTGAFPDTGSVNSAPLYGVIVSGSGYGDQTTAQLQLLSNLGNSPWTAIGQDLGANAKVLGKNLLYPLGSGTSIGLAPDAIFKMVYNEMTDEYALLYEASGNLAIGVFDRQTYQIKKETFLYQASGGNAFCGDLAWNGTRYLAVWGVSGGAGTGNPVPLRYASLTSSLAVEDAGQSNKLVVGNQGIFSLEDVIGNTEGTIPGPTYQAQNFTTQTMTPGWRNCCVRWNPRLNRWIVSGSIYWMPAVGVFTKQGQYQLASGTYAAPTNTLVDEVELSSTTCTAVSSNNITLHLTSTQDKAFLQPGLKLAWLDPSGGTMAWGGNAMIVAVNGSYPTLTVTLSCAPPSLLTTLVVGSFFVLPREDVIIWTLGYDTPSVQFEDADGCFLENVTFSGGGSDIEEKYTRMARPIWQTGGPAVGQPAQNSQQRVSQYNHLLLTPSNGKVNLLRYSNVRSTSKLRYGPVWIPSSPTYDRSYPPRERG